MLLERNRSLPKRGRLLPKRGRLLSERGRLLPGNGGFLKMGFCKVKNGSHRMTATEWHRKTQNNSVKFCVVLWLSEVL